MTLAASAVAQTAEPLFDQGKAWSHLLWQCANGPRKPGTPAHKKTRDQLVAELQKACSSVSLQEFDHDWSTTGSKVTMWNIVAEQPNPTAKQHVLLIAHWDTRPTADREADEEKRKKPILGANDGASGVAVLLELARVMKIRQPNVAITYLLVDGEDLGPGIDEMFLGARYYAKTLKAKKPNYGILLDMIGGKGLKVPVEPNSHTLAKPLVTSFFSYARTLGLDKSFVNEWGPEILDDHLSLNEAGVPTMDLIDFSYPAWHSLRDTPEECSPDSLGSVGKMLEGWLMRKTVFRYPKQ